MLADNYGGQAVGAQIVAVNEVQRIGRLFGRKHRLVGVRAAMARASERMLAVAERTSP